MRIGACFSPEPGLVRMKHVRAAIGPGVKDLAVVGLVVTAGSVASHIVELTKKPSGRGDHIVFRCPRCGEPRAVLYVDEESTLACAGCSGHMTRRHRESSRNAWEEYGHELEDRLFRAVMKSTTLRGLHSLRRVRRLVDELVDGDRDRLSAAMERANAVLAFTNPDAVQGSSSSSAARPRASLPRAT